MKSTEVRKFIGSVITNYVNGHDCKAQCYYDLESIDWNNIEETDGISIESLQTAVNSAYEMMERIPENHK